VLFKSQIFSLSREPKNRPDALSRMTFTTCEMLKGGEDWFRVRARTFGI
jgi:hypothetical protein